MKPWRILIAIFLGLSSSARAEEGVAFTAEHSDFGHEPWLFFDGETRFLGDLSPGADLGDGLLAPTVFSTFGGKILFVADDARHGIELWELGPQGPSLPGELVNGLESVLPGPVLPFRDEGLFMVRTDSDRQSSFTQIWAIRESDRRLLYDCRSAGREWLNGPFPDGNRVIFCETSFPFPDDLEGDRVKEWTLLSYDGTGFSAITSGKTTGITPASAVLFQGALHIYLTGESGQLALYRLVGDALQHVIDLPAAGRLLAAGSSLYGINNSTSTSWRFDGTNLSVLTGALRDWDQTIYTGAQISLMQAVAQHDDILSVYRGAVYRIRDGISAIAPEFSSLRVLGRLKPVGGAIYCHGALAQPTGPDLRGIVRLDPAGPILIAPVDQMDSDDFHLEGDTVVYALDHDLVVQTPQDLTRYPIADSQIVAEPPLDSNPARGLHYQGWYYFPATSPSHGRELWRTDGTQVELVADLNPGPLGSEPTALVVYRNILYFRAQSQNSPRWRGLYRHDGTKTELWDGGGESPVWGRVDSVQVIDNLLIVQNADEARFWSWDGVEPPIELGFRTLVLRGWFRGEPYFAARENSETHHGTELWRLRNGSFELVADLLPGPASGSPIRIIVFQDKLYFSASSPDGQRVLWVYDGVSATEVDPSGPCTFPTEFTIAGEHLYFFGTSVEHGVELWTLRDGKPRLVADLAPGPASSRFDELTSFEGTLLFAAWTPADGIELRSCSDGETVELVADLVPGCNSSTPSLVLTAADGCYWNASIPGKGRLLYQFGRAGLELRTPGSSPPRGAAYLASSGDTDFFAATGPAGRELYRLDPGSPLTLLSDLNPGSASSNPSILDAVNNRLICAGDSNQDGREVLIATADLLLPATTSCEVRWFDLAPGHEALYPRNGTFVERFVGMPNGLYFWAHRIVGATSESLFLYDGSRTEEVVIEAAGAINSLDRLGDRLYLTVGSQLLEVTGLTTNPLPGGERLLASPPFHPFGDKWIFKGRDSANPASEPWILDNGLVSPIAPGFPATRPEWFTPVGGQMYFRACAEHDSPPAFRLYRTDGLTVEEVNLGPARALDEYQSVLAVAGPNLFVLAPSGAGPAILVITPTGLVAPSGQPGGVSAVREPTALNDNLYFISRIDHLHPEELFFATPEVVAKLPETKHSALTAADDRLYFGATSAAGNRELFYHVPGQAATQVPSTFFSPWPAQPANLFWAHGKLYLNASKDVDAGFAIDAAYELTLPSTWRELSAHDADWFLESDRSIIYAKKSLDLVKILRPDGSIFEPAVALSDDLLSWHPFRAGMVTTGTRNFSETELYYVDGTEATILAESRPGPLSSDPKRVAVVELETLAFQHPFARWLVSQGLPSEGAPEDWATLQDRFGTPLLVKYALGLDFNQPMAPLQIRNPDQGTISVTLQIPSEVIPGVILVVETSKTLDFCDWEPLATRGPSGLWIQDLGLVVFEVQGTRRTVTITLPRDLESGRYFRLRADVAR